MAKAAHSRLLLVRSGRTEWDLLGRVQGAADLPPAKAGLEAIQVELATLGGQALNAVVTAPDEASRTTAKMLAEATGAKKVVVNQDLAEMALGLWEGLRYEELEGRYCRAGRLFLEDPSGVMAPAGEAMESYAAKLQGGLAKVLGRYRAGSAVGLVVRPIALGLIRCLLNRADVCELWSMLKDRPDTEWYQITKNDPRFVAPPRRPRRRAAA